jgi:hypothetical protein
MPALFISLHHWWFHAYCQLIMLADSAGRVAPGSAKLSSWFDMRPHSKSLCGFAWHKSTLRAHARNPSSSFIHLICAALHKMPQNL